MPAAVSRNEIANRFLALVSDAAGMVDLPRGADPTVQAIRAIQRWRRARDAAFPGLFADPAWDMLLDLTAAQMERRPVSVSSLCIASGSPATTALRHIDVLERDGLITKWRCPEDKRRTYVEILPEAADKVRDLLARAPGAV